MTPTDPRPDLGLALDQTGRLIDAITDGQLAAPTPCEEYAVRDLLSHLLSVVRRIDLALRGGNLLDVPPHTHADDWSGAWKDCRGALDSTLLDDAVLAVSCQLPWGSMPGAAAISAFTSEFTMHGWDLAIAIERSDLLDERLAEACLPIARQLVPAEPRGGDFPFGPVVVVPADAPPYSRLAGWMGREPAWSRGAQHPRASR